MRANPVAAFFLGLFLVVSHPVMAESGEDKEPRDFGYIGSQTIDPSCCLFYRPPDLPPPPCDETEGVLGSGIHGFGEGRFCEIQKGREVRVSLMDEFVEDPEAGVYCPTEEGPYQIFGFDLPYEVRSYKKIGEAGSTPAITVSQDCMDTQGQRGPGVTDLLVLLRPGRAMAGTATLVYTD